MKKITVTIGIPAFNEEQNIGNILTSVVNQKVTKAVIKEILVYSDASTDSTHHIVKELSKIYPVIKLKIGKSRKGKYFRVNELFRLNTSDILIILDADIALVGNKVIEKLVAPLMKDSKALMVAAQNIFIKPKGFIARVLYAHFMIWDFIQLNMPKLDSAAHYSGTATAYRGTFAQSLEIPSSANDPHFFIYLSAKKKDGFRFSTKAHILQVLPATLDDMKKLLNRSIGKKDPLLEQLFGEELLYESSYFPTKTKIIGVWKAFVHDPFFTPLGFLVSYYLGKITNRRKADKSPVWEINLSTKRPLSYAK